MSTEELLQIVKDRGLSVAIQDGQPVLRPAGSPAATARLMAVLKLHRERIVAQLTRRSAFDGPEAAGPVELLFPGTGLIAPHAFPEHGWPVGAYFWRTAGADAWQPIPGRVWDAAARQQKDWQRRKAG